MNDRNKRRSVIRENGRITISKLVPIKGITGIIIPPNVTNIKPTKVFLLNDLLGHKVMFRSGTPLILSLALSPSYLIIIVCSSTRIANVVCFYPTSL